MSNDVACHVRACSDQSLVWYPVFGLAVKNEKPGIDQQSILDFVTDTSDTQCSIVHAAPPAS
jgi:hypothetical protein